MRQLRASQAKGQMHMIVYVYMVKERLWQLDIVISREYLPALYI
jgi:hypothetical protein